MKKFRLLRADEIDARIQSVNVQKKGCGVLLYKDARCDMNILDETVGCENWQRSHEIIDGNLYCNVGINFKNDDGFDRWVWKQDVGTESNTEKEKGQASDSFKRACFNWGIGRELYTAPFIWIQLNDDEIVNGKCYAKFIVKEITYNDKEEIKSVVIVDEKGNQRYPKVNNQPKSQPIQQPIKQNVQLITNEQLEILNRQDDKVKAFALKKFNVQSLNQLSMQDAEYIINSMQQKGTLK